MPEDSAVDFGTYLREARERRGVSLRQIATATKISLSALEALERNDISRLPGGIFTRAFVRAYAREVGLDPEPTVREFVVRFPHESVIEGSPYVPQPREDLKGGHRRSRLPGSVRMAGVLVPVLLAIAYFGLSDRLWKRSQGEAPVTVVAKTQPTSPAPAQAARPSQPPPNESTPPVPAGLLKVDQPAAAIEGNELRLTLSPRATCWVWAQTDGVEVLAELMQAGDKRELRAREEILLKVGDAGALAFAINGAAGRALGASGAVVTARITPQNYKTYLVVQN
jgi:cytoskeleton protein RodZ